MSVVVEMLSHVLLLVDVLLGVRVGLDELVEVVEIFELVVPEVLVILVALMVLVILVVVPEDVSQLSQSGVE